MFKKLVDTLHVLVCAVLIVQLTGCGTIMYPERKGQKGGRLDSGVVILDALGLLFFLSRALLPLPLTLTMERFICQGHREVLWT